MNIIGVLGLRRESIVTTIVKIIPWKHSVKKPELAAGPKTGVKQTTTKSRVLIYVAVSPQNAATVELVLRCI